MQILKRLYDAVKTSRMDQDIQVAEAMTAAHEFLSVAKSFEYTGTLSLSTGNVVRLKDIATDFDDIVRMLGGKRQDVSVPCQLLVLVIDESEVKRRQEEAKARAQTLAVPHDATPEAPGE